MPEVLDGSKFHKDPGQLVMGVGPQGSKLTTRLVLMFDLFLLFGCLATGRISYILFKDVVCAYL